VTRKFTRAAAEVFDRSAVAYIVGWMTNPEDHPVRVRVQVAADDEVGVAINEQSVIETLGWKPQALYTQQVLLPPGLNQVKIVYHKFWHNGGVAFSSIDEHGHPVEWKCDPGFH